MPIEILQGKAHWKNEAGPEVFLSLLFRGMLDPKEDGRALVPVHFYKAKAPCTPLLGMSFHLCHVGLSSAGITNCEFYAGQAEKILPQLLKSKENGQLIVAVVNPARAGLRKDE